MCKQVQGCGDLVACIAGVHYIGVAWQAACLPNDEIHRLREGTKVKDIYAGVHYIGVAWHAACLPNVYQSQAFMGIAASRTCTTLLSLGTLLVSLYVQASSRMRGP